jgi:hypothetical protein
MLEIPPTAGLIDHCTPVFVVPATLAVNCCVCPAVSELLAGVTDTATGSSVIDAVADLELSAMLVAFTLTICCAVTRPGAEYTPALETLPTAGETLQETEVFVVPVTVDVNCWVCDAFKEDALGVTATETEPVDASTITLALPMAVGSSLQIAFTVTVC